MMSLYLPRILVSALVFLEKLLLRSVDYTITASTIFADKLKKQSLHSISTIGNYHSIDQFKKVDTKDTIALRNKLGLLDNELMITYIGGFSRNRLLTPLIEATRGQKNIQVFFWGDGHQKAAIENAIANAPNIHYLGWLAATDVPVTMMASDIIYYCLESNYPGAIYNAPNTLSQTMAAGRPIIANDVGDLGRIVKETGCGILLSLVTPETIRQAIEKLRAPTVRKQLGQAGLEAAETKYNWDYAKLQLLQVYAKILEK
jgi:glycosyltransferase involved in cell wall biosynthesis